MRLVSGSSMKTAQEAGVRFSGRLFFLPSSSSIRNCPDFLGFPLLPAQFMQLVQRCPRHESKMAAGWASIVGLLGLRSEEKINPYDSGSKPWQTHIWPGFF